MPKISDIENTPNPNAMKFVLKEPLTWGIAHSYDNAAEAKDDPLAGKPGWQPVPGVTLRLTLRGHSNWIGRIAWSPDGKWLASPSKDMTIRIWDAVTGKVVRTLKGHTSEVNSVAWSPDGLRLASASHDRTVRLWDAQTGQALRILAGHSQAVGSVA